MFGIFGKRYVDKYWVDEWMVHNDEWCKQWCVGKGKQRDLIVSTGNGSGNDKSKVSGHGWEMVMVMVYNNKNRMQLYWVLYILL